MVKRGILAVIFGLTLMLAISAPSQAAPPTPTQALQADGALAAQRLLSAMSVK